MAEKETMIRGMVIKDGILAKYVGTDSHVEIPEEVIAIGKAAFYDCQGLASVVIPNTVSEIGNSAFQNCYFLTSVTFKGEIREIGNYAFNNCRRLTSIELPAGLTRIAISLFEGCISLSTVRFGGRIERIEKCAFKNCVALTEINLPTEPFVVEEEAFAGCIHSGITLSNFTVSTSADFVTEDVEIDFSRRKKECVLKKYVGRAEFVMLPDKVHVISPRVFAGDRGIKLMTLPKGIKRLGSEMLKGAALSEIIYQGNLKDFYRVEKEKGWNVTVFDEEKGEVAGWIEVVHCTDGDLRISREHFAFLGRPPFEGADLSVPLAYYPELPALPEGEKIVLHLGFGDHKDWNNEDVSVERKGDGYEVVYSNSNWWRAGQTERELKRTRIADTEENRTLIGLLYSRIRDVLDFQKEVEDDIYDTMGDTGLYVTTTENGTPVRRFRHTDIITGDMVEIFSRWVELSDSYREKVCNGYGTKSQEGLDSQKVVKEREPLYSLSYSAGGVRYNYMVMPKEYNNYYAVATERIEGNKEYFKERNIDRDPYPEFKEHLTAWSLACVRAGEDAPISITYEGETFRTFKVPRKLADILDYFSPEGFSFPAELIEEGSDSVYVILRKSIPDEAYMDSKSLRYLCIAADSESIGKRAFARSALEHVEFRAPFWAHSGVGNMPTVGEDAFDDCFGLGAEMTFYDGKKYLGKLDGYCEYSIEIGPIR